MLWHGHIAFGYIVTIFLLSFLSPDLNQNQISSLIIWGIIFSVLPDIDFILSFLKTKNIKLHTKHSHRDLLTHAPILWFLVGISIFIFATNSYYQAFGLILWLSSWSHFLGDSIEYGIMWLWPFTRKKFAFHNITDNDKFYNKNTIQFYWNLFTKVYIKNYTFYIENLMFIVFLYIIFN